VIKKHLMRIVLVLVICGVTPLGFAHSGATGIVKQRMDQFTRSKDNLKAIKAHIAAENYQEIQRLASEIKDWAESMPDYFPVGGDQKLSEASPQIWVDFSGFKRAADAHATAAGDLVIAASHEDKTAVIAAMAATAASCKSCHKRYKLDSR